ncbi:Peroxiredoxin-5, mitochondrial [Lignoscripta atroalba]|nr:Peroxiredoxin-5, mitochondrial [Lignoscripta atroalba]
MFAGRKLAIALRRAISVSRPAFHTTSPAFVRAGDSIPDLDVLTENSPGNKVNLAKELTGKGLIIGVPAAFSPSCSNSHIPSYLNSEFLKDAGKVFVVSVNDPFVMKAWATTLDPDSRSGVQFSLSTTFPPPGLRNPTNLPPTNQIRFLADPTTSFTSALDLLFDGSAIFGGPRSKRYALVVDEGKVKEAFVEPDATGVDGMFFSTFP